MTYIDYIFVVGLSCGLTNEAGFEAKHQVRETLRERRLALLNPGNASGLSEWRARLLAT